MKLKIFLLAALAAAGMANMASAQTTIVNITGATAFRSGAVTGIRAAYGAGVQYGYTGTNFGGATQHIFVGSFPGITGTTIIRTFWSGSTEGARSVVFGLNNPYQPTTASVSTAGTQNLANGTAPGLSNLYFSDVNFTKTVYSTFNPSTLPLPNPPAVQTSVGAIVFCPVKNKMANTNPEFANYNNFTNITANQFRSLFGLDNSGRMLLSQLTGVTSDNDVVVFATGRNDLSGTRTSYLLESGYGPQNPVIQWKMFSNTANVITTLQIWPIGDVVGNVDNRSVQWTLADTSLPDSPPFPQGGLEQAGNGGYFSGGTISGQFDDTSQSVDLADDAGSVFASAQNVILVSYLGNNDALNAINAGAKALTWNGYGVTPANPLSDADKAKITNGQYTAWNFEQFVKATNATAADTTIYNAVIAALPGNIGNSGLTMAEMAGVLRPQDGGTITIAVP
jgi:hypothetical protein